MLTSTGSQSQANGCKCSSCASRCLSTKPIMASAASLLTTIVYHLLPCLFRCPTSNRQSTNKPISGRVVRGCRLHNDSKKMHGTVQQETLTGMSSSDMEDWWSLSPEDLALLQADPNYHPQLNQKQGRPIAKYPHCWHVSVKHHHPSAVSETCTCCAGKTLVACCAAEASNTCCESRVFNSTSGH